MERIRLEEEEYRRKKEFERELKEKEEKRRLEEEKLEEEFQKSIKMGVGKKKKLKRGIKKRLWDFRERLPVTIGEKVLFVMEKLRDMDKSHGITEYETAPFLCCCRSVEKHYENCEFYQDQESYLRIFKVYLKISHGIDFDSLLSV